MAYLNVTEFTKMTTDVFSNLSLFEYFQSIRVLLFFVLGIFIYSIFIFKFYRFVAKRDILKLKLDKYSEGFSGFIESFFKVLLYLFENMILIPLLVFFWVVVLSLLLVLLSKNHTPGSILLTSVAIIAVVRATAYYDEDLSRDLAKMIPFALLGVFLVDITFFSFENSIEVLKTMISFWHQGLYYLLFVVVLEFVLRLINGIVRLTKGDVNEE